MTLPLCQTSLERELYNALVLLPKLQGNSTDLLMSQQNAVQQGKIIRYFGILFGIDVSLAE